MNNMWKSFCFDNGYVEEDLKKAWNKGLETNGLIQRLEKIGKDYTGLNQACLKDLMKKYGGANNE